MTAGAPGSPGRRAGARERRLAQTEGTGAGRGATGRSRELGQALRECPKLRAAVPAARGWRQPGEEREAAAREGPKFFLCQVSGSGSREADRRATGGASAPPRLSDSDHGLVPVALATLQLLEAGGPEPPARLPQPRGAARAALGCRRRHSGEARRRARRPGAEVTAPMTAARRNEWELAARASGPGAAELRCWRTPGWLGAPGLAGRRDPSPAGGRGAVGARRLPEAGAPRGRPQSAVLGTQEPRGLGRER